MNRLWLTIIIFGMLLTLVFAPFAGFAPLLTIILIAGIYWFVSSLAQILIFGEPTETDKDSISNQ